MAQIVVKNVPNDQVAAYCELNRSFGATKCEATDNGDGTSNVLVEVPDDD